MSSGDESSDDDDDDDDDDSASSEEDSSDCSSQQLSELVPEPVLPMSDELSGGSGSDEQSICNNTLMPEDPCCLPKSGFVPTQEPPK